MWAQQLLLAAEREAEEAEEAEAVRGHEALARLGWRSPDAAAAGEPCWCCWDEDEDGDGEEDSDGESDAEEPQPRAGGAGPATFCGLRRAFLCPAPAPLPDFALPQERPWPRPSAEEAERNAEELVAEEERLKRRAEKKRLKKRRRKDRKRQARRQQQLQAESAAGASDASWSHSTPGVPNSLGPDLLDSEGSSTQNLSENQVSSGGSTEDETEEELDLTSTFVSKACLKVGPKPLLPPLLRKGKAASSAGKELEAEVQQEITQPPSLQMRPVEQSLVLADCANETAKRGCYREAVLLFTEAVKLNPREYRFFGNRSFCYEKLQCHAEALCDAQLALSLQPDWPKGLFRQGKALMGLKRFAEAARTFEELLRLEGFRQDAAIQLERCRVQLLLENGFTQYNPLKWDVLAGKSQLPLPGLGASGELWGLVTLCPLLTRTLCCREWFAVWVGNLTPQVTQEVLLRCFQPFGPIDSIRRLPRRFCAFVNYTRKEAAEAAFRTLQGAEVEGSRLLLQLKHPAHATPLPTKAPSGL
ncbi:hypothetical protein lerEdw1_019916 [Lerista edwardsae]|nr:hypothetical protein lerEdw1_019916 [Lerista edwardsae]